MADEGYLQNKIRELQQENKKLEEGFFELDNKFKILHTDIINALKEQR